MFSSLTPTFHLVLHKNSSQDYEDTGQAPFDLACQRFQCVKMRDTTVSRSHPNISAPPHLLQGQPFRQVFVVILETSPTRQQLKSMS
jgi:hypothetical protein